MKSTAVLLAVMALPSFADTVISNPIVVSGGGSFSCDNTGDGGYTFHAAGSNGPDSVALGGDFGRCGFVALSSLGGSITPGSSSWINAGASIDSVSSRYFSFQIGGQGDYLALYDPGGVLLASAQLIGSVFLTSYSSCCSDRYYGDSGTFLIGTPEPCACGLVFTGGAMLVLRRYRRKSPRHHRQA